MKYFSLFSFVMAFFSTSLQAQFIKSLAIKGGVSLANQDWHYKLIHMDRKTQMLPGAYGAAEIEFIRKKVWGFSTEFHYCQKGHMDKIPITSDANPDQTIALAKINFRFNYLSVVPLLNLRHETKHWTAYMAVGPRLDYFVSSTINGQKSTIAPVRTFIFGWTAGLGWQYNIGQAGIFAEAKFMQDQTDAISTEFLSAKNRAGVICAGLRYNFNARKNNE